VAPVVGPTLGGWLTDTYSWRWCFYINLPCGIIATLMCLRYLPDTHGGAGPKARPDWLGMALLVVGIGALQIVLDRGERADWFDAGWVWAFTIVAAACLVVFVVWELHVEEPVVKLRLLADRGLAIGCWLIFCMAFILFGSIALSSLYLQNLMGFSAAQAGWASAPRGVATGTAMFVVGRLARKVDPRLLIGLGTVLVITGQWWMSHFNLQLGWWEIVTPTIVQGAGFGFIFTLLSTTALARVPRMELGNAASIYNLTRNMGASVGIAVLGTELVRREQFHQAVLSSYSSPLYGPFARALQAIPGAMAARGVIMDTAQSAALLYGQLRAQATMLAFADTFLIAGLMATCILIGVLFMPYARPRAGEVPAAH